MDSHGTALVLIGFQNDYFASDGILHGVIEEAAAATGVLRNTVHLIEPLSPSPVLIVSTPIRFAPDYAELENPVGILKVVKEVGAFKAGGKGSETIPELLHFGERIVEVPGKQGLNAFSNTDLDRVFHDHGVTNIVIAGVVTSVCIDSTGRSATEKGYEVTVLSDCTSGRTLREQDFYCNDILPLYANVIDSQEFLQRLGIGSSQGQPDVECVT